MTHLMNRVPGRDGLGRPEPTRRPSEPVLRLATLRSPMPITETQLIG
jgi:hypothetical protein